MEPTRRPSGLLVPTRVRSIPAPGPLGQPPRSEMTPNENDPIGSVGPDVPIGGDSSAQEAAEGGFGSTHVMYPMGSPPLEAAAWAGWPVGWNTPNTNSLGGMPTASMVDVVWAAIDLNARVSADFPVFTVKSNGAPVPSPTWLYNPQPEMYSCWQEFFKVAWWSYQAAGEVFIVATSRFADGYPRTFMAISPMYVSIDVSGGIRRYYIGGQEVDGSDLLHIRYSSWPGDDGHGHGPLEVAGYRLLAAYVLMKYATDLAMNGGVPWAVLKHKLRLGEKQATKVKEQWIASARNRQGAPAILDQDMDLQVLQVPPKDMALAEMQAYMEARISTLLGVAPYLLSLPTGADSLTYTNVSSIFDSHWRTTLRPGSRFIMSALAGWALPWGTECQVNPQAYVQPTPAERVTYYKAMVEIGAMTPAEVRAAEHLPPAEEAVAPAAAALDDQQGAGINANA